MKEKGNARTIFVNVFIKKEEEEFVAHCLEFDLVATASTLKQVQGDIVDIVMTHVDYALCNNNLENMFRSAPKGVWDEFYACRKAIEKRRRFQSSFKNDPPEALPAWLIANMNNPQRSCHNMA